MLSRLLSNIQAGWWSQASTCIFLLVFLAILVWAYLPNRRKSMEEGSRLPFED